MIKEFQICSYKEPWSKYLQFDILSCSVQDSLHLNFFFASLIAWYFLVLPCWIGFCYVNGKFVVYHNYSSFSLFLSQVCKIFLNQMAWFVALAAEIYSASAEDCATTSLNSKRRHHYPMKKIYHEVLFESSVLPAYNCLHSQEAVHFLLYYTRCHNQLYLKYPLRLSWLHLDVH